MKKIIYLIIDFCLLLAAIIYLIFKYKKVDGEGWSQGGFEKTLILANGPSLKVDIERVIKERIRSEVYVLNSFAVTKYFKEIKPEYYVLTDRMYWSQHVNDDFKKDNENLFLCLDQVDWKMNLICPERGFQWISQRLLGNNNIEVLKVHSVNVEFTTEKINLFALNKNIITPNFINGLVMMLWHTIYRKRLDIEIYGADFSLFKEYYVDQKTNELGTSLSHFYENTKAQSNATYKYPEESKKMLHTRLYQQWSSFYQMYLLSKIAKIRKIKITNYSSNSYLDCFDRPK
jgi:hypothetical protein